MVVSNLSQEYISQQTEVQDGKATDPVTWSLDKVDICDCVVLIAARRYGHIPQLKNPDGLSVTEHEYRYATYLNKPLLAFLSAEPDHQDGPCRDGTLMSQDDPENRLKLQAFRKSVLDHAVRDFFWDINTFSQRLTKTLSEFIYESVRKEKDLEFAPLRRIAQEHQQIRVIIRQLKPRFVAAIAHAEMVRQLKVLHEHVHTIRQSGIRRLREEVLVLWPTKELRIPEGDCESTFDEASRSIEKELALILRGELDSARAKVNDVVQALPSTQGLGREGAYLRRKNLTADLDGFARRIQSAFTKLNAELQGAREQYDQSISALKTACTLPLLGAGLQVPASVRPVYHSQMEKVDTSAGTLSTLIREHDTWQKIHDALEVIDNGADSVQSSTDIAKFLTDHKSTFHQIVQTRLQDEPENLKCRAIAEWLSAPDVQNWRAYKKMRHAFDDEFYDVDSAVLDSVKNCFNELDATREVFEKIAEIADGPMDV